MFPQVKSSGGLGARCCCSSADDLGYYPRCCCAAPALLGMISDIFPRSCSEFLRGDLGELRRADDLGRVLRGRSSRAAAPAEPPGGVRAKAPRPFLNPPSKIFIKRAIFLKQTY